MKRDMDLLRSTLSFNQNNDGLQSLGRSGDCALWCRGIGGLIGQKREHLDQKIQSAGLFPCGLKVIETREFGLIKRLQDPKPQRCYQSSTFLSLVSQPTGGFQVISSSPYIGILLSNIRQSLRNDLYYNDRTSIGRKSKVPCLSSSEIQWAF